MAKQVLVGRSAYEATIWEWFKSHYPLPLEAERWVHCVGMYTAVNQLCECSTLNKCIARVARWREATPAQQLALWTVKGEEI